MSARVSVRHEGDVAIVDISGRLTFGEDSGGLRERVREFVAQGQLKILFNFSAVTFVDSSGIGELTGCHVAMTHSHGRLRICGLTRRVRDLFEMTRIYNVLNVDDSEEDALRAFASTAR